MRVGRVRIGFAGANWRRAGPVVVAARVVGTIRARIGVGGVALDAAVPHHLGLQSGCFLKY